MSADNSSKINITTKRVTCRQSKQMPKWEGLTPESLYKAGRLEHKIRKAGTTERQSLKKLHCNVFKGRRPPVPSILYIVHRTRKSSKGRDVVVTPDTGATMTIIPWALVHKLGIKIDVEDSNYNLVTASGDQMTVLGTVVIYLHPEGAHKACIWNSNG